MGKYLSIENALLAVFLEIKLAVIFTSNFIVASYAGLPPLSNSELWEWQKPHLQQQGKDWVMSKESESSALVGVGVRFASVYPILCLGSMMKSPRWFREAKCRSWVSNSFLMTAVINHPKSSSLKYTFILLWFLVWVKIKEIMLPMKALWDICSLPLRSSRGFPYFLAGVFFDPWTSIAQHLKTSSL